MPAGPDFMRPLRAGEEEMAEALLTTAYSNPKTAALLRSLRAAGQIELEMVLPWGTGLAGYLALSRLAAPAGWLALGPLAIAPDWQGQGWGTRFVAGVAKLAAIKGQTVVVQGRPGFFTRCGFSAPRAAGLILPDANPPALICRPGDDSPRETVAAPPV